MTKNQIFAAIEKSLNLGVKKFALHTMIISNCLNESEIFANAKMMFDLVVEIFVRTDTKHLVNYLMIRYVIT